MAFTRLIAIGLLTTFVARPGLAPHPLAPAYRQLAAADDKLLETGAKGEAQRPHVRATPPPPVTHRASAAAPRPAPQEDHHSDDYVCEHGDPQSDLTIDACFRRDHATHD